MSRIPTVTPYREAPRSGAACSGCSSCSDVREAMTVRKRFKALHVLQAGIVATVFGAHQLLQAQTPATTAADAFFDDSVVHTINININSRDWQSLKDHYLDNDYYPCDFKW